MDKLKKQFIKEVWHDKKYPHYQRDDSIVLPYIFTDWEWTENDMYGGPEGEFWYRIRVFGIREERTEYEKKKYDGDIIPFWITEILKKDNMIKREHWEAGKTSMDHYLDHLNIKKRECEERGLTIYWVE